MRGIKHIVVHCTATQQTATVGAIQKHWREQLKWRAPGYHKIIDAAGNVTTLATDEKICNGVAGHNSVSLHVSYIGGVDANGKPMDNRTPAQKNALLNVLNAWVKIYPNANILGHKDFAGVKKACPSFNAINEYKHLKP
jgi:N-acetylmuramoyl-L-alanine amidase